MSDWASACGLKRAFGSVKEAERMMRRRGITDQVAYRCEFCHQYHIGHPPHLQVDISLISS